jgi:hypothetical protein
VARHSSTPADDGRLWGVAMGRVETFASNPAAPAGLPMPRHRARLAPHVDGPSDTGEIGSGGKIRTYDQAVNSRPLYH